MEGCMPIYEHILVATDGSHHSDAAVNYAINLAKTCNGRLTILHVATIDPSIGMIWEDVKDIVMTRMGEMLGKVKKKAEKKGVRVNTLLEKGIPSEMILKVAKRENVDVIVMGSHGHTKVGKIITGSVTERVIEGSWCPVLVIGKKCV